MAVVATLMDKARQKRGIPSDNALAGALGRSRQVVSQWRSGDAYPDEELIVALAEMAGDNPAEWLVAVKAVRSDGKAGKVWAALAKRLGAAAAVVLCAIGFALPVVGKAHQTDVSPCSPDSEIGSLHIMSGARWVALGRVWRYYWLLLKLLLDRLLHGDSSPTENRSLEACR